MEGKQAPSPMKQFTITKSNSAIKHIMILESVMIMSNRCSDNSIPFASDTWIMLLQKIRSARSSTRHFFDSSCKEKGVNRFYRNPTETQIPYTCCVVGNTCKKQWPPMLLFLCHSVVGLRCAIRSTFIFQGWWHVKIETTASHREIQMMTSSPLDTHFWSSFDQITPYRLLALLHRKSHRHTDTYQSLHRTS